VPVEFLSDGQAAAYGRFGGEFLDGRAWTHAVLNAVVLWNTCYTDAAVTALRAEGHPVHDDDVARLSPLGDAHINMLGRYAFTAHADAVLRPLRAPLQRDA
jgi:hypothetical protein